MDHWMSSRGRARQPAWTADERGKGDTVNSDGRIDLADPRLTSAITAAVTRFGPDLWSSPGKTRAVLSDELGDASTRYRAELDLLEQSATIGLADAAHAGRPTEPFLGQLTALGIDPGVAEQIDRTWRQFTAPITANVLTTPTIVAIPPTPTPVPTGPDDATLVTLPIETTTRRSGPATDSGVNPNAEVRRDRRLWPAAAAFVTVVTVLVVGAVLVVGPDHDTGATLTGPTTPTVTQVTVPTTGTIVMTPASVKAFFGDRIAGNCTSAMTSGRDAYYLCSGTTADNVTYDNQFWIYADPADAATRMYRGFADVESEVTNGGWSAPTGRSGSYRQSTRRVVGVPAQYCRDWTYEGLPYFGEVCTTTSQTALAELVARYQN